MKIHVFAFRTAFLAALLIGAAPTAFALTLAKDGKATTTIYLHKDAPAKVNEGARDLARVLAAMSGGTWSVKPVTHKAGAPAGQPAIVLGKLAEALGGIMPKRSPGRDGFRYQVKGKRLLIVGESAQGVYHGVFAFLEHLGCGWFAPGPVGEVLPKKPTIHIDDKLDHAEVSDSIHRRIWYGGKNAVRPADRTWLERNKAHLIRGSWRHAWGHLVSKKLITDKPGLFAYSKQHDKRRNRQLCTTNPETIELASETLLRAMAKAPGRLVFEAGPNDGGGLCECKNCAKLHTPGYLEPSSGKPCYTDVVFKFASDLANITSKKHPEKYLGILVYSEYSRPPKKITSVNKNVFPMIAPIRRSRFHGPGNPRSASAKMHGEEITAWAKVSDKLGFYVYNYNLADTLIPFTKFDFYRRLLKLVHGSDVKTLAWVCETIDSWAPNAPHIYLSSRIAWNSRVNINAELDRFFDGFYGAASAPMKRYWLRIDQAYANSPTSTGSQYGQRQIWTDQVLAASRRDLDKAKRLANTEREMEAVAMADAGLVGAELFVSIWDAIGRCEFAAASKAQQELKAHIGKYARGKTPSWYHQRYAWGYYARFVGRTVDGGAKALQNGGGVAVRFPPEWKFRKDEDAKGAEKGWHRIDFDDQGWEKHVSFHKSWGEYGLEWYHGDAWYRASFKPPKDLMKADARLWFGGFDHNVDVYLNGVHLGERKGFVTPGEFPDIVKHLRPGAKNVLAVRVSAGGLAELGTGGIMMPVMIYVPGKAAETKTGTKDKKKKKKRVDYEM